MTQFNFLFVGCYAMPREEAIVNVTLPASQLINFRSFCSQQCIKQGGFQYFVVQQNASCGCIDDVPLGGKFRLG